MLTKSPARMIENAFGKNDDEMALFHDWKRTKNV